MKETKYERKGMTIFNLETGEKKTFKSNNKAKQASHKIQMDADKALGRGTLRLRS